MPAAGVLEILLWVLRRRRFHTVSGSSMEPTLADGDLVLVDPRAYRDRLPESGHVVVARHPFRRSILWVKRVHEVTPEGRLELIGDNPGASTDSRTQGQVPLEKVHGRVTSRWACG